MHVNHYHFCYTIGWSHERCLPWRASHAFILCLFTNIMDRRQSSAVKWYKHKPKVPSRMDNPERTDGAIKNGQSRKKTTVPSRMDNPEKTDGAIKNGQSRENRRCHQEWTIQRKPTMPSRMDNLEKLATWGTQSTRRTQTKQKIQHNMCWTPLYVNKHN